jgi:hypothetical protein
MLGETVAAWTRPQVYLPDLIQQPTPSSTAGLIGGDTTWLYPLAHVGLQPCARLSKELRAAVPWTPVNSGLRPAVHLTFPTAETITGSALGLAPTDKGSPGSFL